MVDRYGIGGRNPRDSRFLIRQSKLGQNGKWGRNFLIQSWDKLEPRYRVLAALIALGNHTGPNHDILGSNLYDQQKPLSFSEKVR